MQDIAQRGTGPFKGLVRGLNALDYEDNAVTLTGRGSGASEVIGLLEASDVFAAAAISSATQRDPNSNAEVFSISATIETPGAAP